MKKFFILALLLSFVGLAVFGFVIMTQDGGCLASMAQGGAVCPPNAGSLEVAAFHLNAYKTFTSATFDSGALAVLFALFLFASLGFLESSLISRVVQISEFGRKIFPAGLSDFKTVLNSWLSLHTNSPNRI